MSGLTRTVTRTAVTAAVAGGAILISAAPAQAADSNLDVIGSYIYYTADAGVTNNVKIAKIPVTPTCSSRPAATRSSPSTRPVPTPCSGTPPGCSASSPA